MPSLLRRGVAASSGGGQGSGGHAGVTQAPFTSLTNKPRMAVPRRLLRRRGPVVLRAGEGKGLSKSQRELLEKEFTRDGGGEDGVCDYKDIREALKECEGLTGDAQRACWATVGCDVDKVTKHYTKVAGMKEDEKKKGEDIGKAKQ